MDVCGYSTVDVDQFLDGVNSLPPPPLPLSYSPPPIICYASFSKPAICSENIYKSAEFILSCLFSLGVTIAGDGLLLLNLRECMGILSDHYLQLDARDYVFSQVCECVCVCVCVRVHYTPQTHRRQPIQASINSPKMAQSRICLAAKNALCSFHRATRLWTMSSACRSWYRSVSIS
jgi:hypothetical protein